MYNKLTLKNNWEEFNVKYDGKEFTVPSGDFEAEENLGHFIFQKSLEWKLNVSINKRQEPEALKKFKAEITVPVNSKEDIVETNKESVDDVTKDVKKEVKKTKK